jgi:hypothetical protein
MPERKKLANINIITDDDTGMYRIGEIDGGFYTEILREHIKKHGITDLIEHLAYMMRTVLEIKQEINLEENEEVEEDIK